MNYNSFLLFLSRIELLYGSLRLLILQSSDCLRDKQGGEPTFLYRTQGRTFMDSGIEGDLCYLARVTFFGSEDIPDVILSLIRLTCHTTLENVRFGNKSTNFLSRLLPSCIK